MNVQNKMKLKADLLFVASLFLVTFGSLYLYYFITTRFNFDPYAVLTAIVIGGVSLFIFLWINSSRSKCPSCGHKFARGWGASYVDLHKAPAACAKCGFHFIDPPKESAS